MKTRIRLILSILFASFLMQAQISKKKQDSELKQINNMVTEAKSVTDQVILDDLIVDGSACIGFDCVNGESFGFDTIRLKENNLRIRAMDTSTSASFPTNDWQITFNDTSNGGANKFSIDDIDGGRTPFTIEAGAPSHSLYVDDGGRIGLGTSTPVVEIHSKDGDTPTLRLEQDGSSGFGAQTWDIAGNETNFFIRDASNGSSLPFRIFPGAPSNALTIEGSTGDIGLGIASPTSTLHIRKSEPIITLDRTGTGANVWTFGALQNHLTIADATGIKTPFLIEKIALDSALTLTSSGLSIKNGGTLTFPDGTIQTTAFGGTIGAFTDLDVTGTAHFRSDVYVKGSIFPSASFGPSDERLKTNFEVLHNATNILKSLYPKSFYFRSEFIKELGLPSEKQYGLIAQDVEKLLPELVKEFETSSGRKYKSVNYTEFIPFLIQGFKEQQLRIEQLEGQISHYASLESRLEKLEKYSNKTSNAKR